MGREACAFLTGQKRRPAIDHGDVDLETDQLCRQTRQPLQALCGVSDLDDDVPALDISVVSQTLPKRFEPCLVAFGRSHGQIAHPRHLRQGLRRDGKWRHHACKGQEETDQRAHAIALTDTSHASSARGDRPSCHPLATNEEGQGRGTLASPLHGRDWLDSGTAGERDDAARASHRKRAPYGQGFAQPSRRSPKAIFLRPLLGRSLTRLSA